MHICVAALFGCLAADATLLFDVELVAIIKPGIEEKIIPLIRFLSFPAIILYAVYYMYKKYKETPSKKDSKDAKKSAGKKRK